MTRKAPSFEGVFFVVFVRKKVLKFVTQKRMNEGSKKCKNSLHICMNEAHELSCRKYMQEIVRFRVIICSFMQKVHELACPNACAYSCAFCSFQPSIIGRSEFRSCIHAPPLSLPYFLPSLTYTLTTPLIYITKPLLLLTIYYILGIFMGLVRESLHALHNLQLFAHDFTLIPVPLLTQL